MKGKHLASINFTPELLEWLDRQASELDISRSALVCFLLNDYKNSDKNVKMVVE